MHPSSYENMQRCFALYRPAGRDGAPLRIADLGASDVNGS